VGPAGPTAVSVDPGNFATLGTDNLIYVPESILDDRYAKKKDVDRGIPISIIYGQESAWRPTADGGWGEFDGLPIKSGFHLNGIETGVAWQANGQVWLGQGTYRVSLTIFSDSGEQVFREARFETYNGSGWTIYPFSPVLSLWAPTGFAGGGTAHGVLTGIISAPADGNWFRVAGRAGRSSGAGAGAYMGVANGSFERLSVSPF
jgi:hypothetical protein